MFENASFMWHNAFCCECVCAVSQKAATTASLKDAPLVAHVAIVAPGWSHLCQTLL